MKLAQYNNNNNIILLMHSVVVFGILYGPSTIVSKIHISATMFSAPVLYAKQRWKKYRILKPSLKKLLWK